MYIRIFFHAIEQAHISIYKDLQLIKYAKRGLINSYLHKMISSISPLQDDSSEVVELNIKRNSRGMSS